MSVAETWKRVPELPVEASNRGRVRLFPGGPVLEPTEGPGGIGPVVEFRLSRSRRTSMPVSALVLEAFVGPIPSYRHLPHHLDNDPYHNRPENLRWALPEEIHPPKPPKRRGQSKLTPADVAEIKRRLGTGESQHWIARDFPVTQAAISMIATGKTWARVEPAG